jgi:hypothetical protein
MDETAQVRFVASVILPEGSIRRGSVRWFGAERARHLIDIGVAVLLEPEAPASVQQPIAESPEKKSSGAVQAGHSTDSPRSSEPGPAPSLSASLAEQVSAASSSLVSAMRGKKGKKSTSSPSTTPTDS